MSKEVTGLIFRNLSFRSGDFIFIRYLCNGFVRSFEGICLVNGKSVTLLGNFYNLKVELTFFRFGCCIFVFLVLNFKRKFLRCSKARLFFLRKNNCAFS